jgi:hypothetical protein
LKAIAQQLARAKKQIVPEAKALQLEDGKKSFGLRK